MRIGHVAYSYRPIIGGAEVYVDRLLATLASAGHDCRVYQRDPGPEERQADPRIVPIAHPGRSLQLFNLLLLARLDQLQREDRLVIHDTIHHPPALVHRGVVALSHGVTWDDPRGGRHNRVRRALARLSWRRARTVVANDTEFLRAMGLDIEPGERRFEEVAPGRFFIPNVVDPETFAPGPGRADLRPHEVILLPRNVSYGRGVHLALAAFARIAQARPRALLVVAGDWLEPAYGRTVRAAIAPLGLAGRVLFLGPVQHTAMVELYRSAAVTCVPSVCSEGTSLAALESMSCGTPVVATAIGGLKDLPCAQAAPAPDALADALARTLAARDDHARRQRAAVLRDLRPERWSQAWLRAVAH